MILCHQERKNLITGVYENETGEERVMFKNGRSEYDDSTN